MTKLGEHISAEALDATTAAGRLITQIADNQGHYSDEEIKDAWHELEAAMQAYFARPDQMPPQHF